MKCSLSQTSYSLVAFTSFMPFLSWQILHAGHHCRQRYCVMPGISVSILKAYRVTICWDIGVSALYKHQLDVFMFNELCRCCLYQWGLTVNLWRSSYKEISYRDIETQDKYIYIYEINLILIHPNSDSILCNHYFYSSKEFLVSNKRKFRKFNIKLDF